MVSTLGLLATHHSPLATAFFRYTDRMIGRPQESEAAPYYAKYVAQVVGDDPLLAIETQLDDCMKLFATISEESSLHRYEPGKWSIREVLSHITDTERVFAVRLMWFARGLTPPLPSLDQDVAVAGAQADAIAWAGHVEEFHQVRLSNISLFRHVPADAWSRSGIASDHRVTVRALAYLIAGHAAHHIAILRQRYLASPL